MANLKAISSDITGQTFGKLTVLEFVGYLGLDGTPKHAHWKTQCACGLNRTVRGTRLLRGKVLGCATCSKREASARAGLTKRLPEPELSIRKTIGYYRANASRKNRVFGLTDDEARALLAGPCRYCGQENANGIDRKDNLLGYTVTNSVSCCAVCNYAKRELSEDSFRDWIVSAFNHFAGKIT